MNRVLFLFLLICCFSCREKNINTKEKQKEKYPGVPRFEKEDINDIFPLSLRKETKLDSFQKKYLDWFFQSYWAQNNTSAGILVAKNGKILFEGYRGFANIEDSILLTADTPLHVASVTKVMTSMVIHKLIEKGKIKLDQSIQSILPKFPYSDITLKNLLNHRSGLPEYSYFPQEFWSHQKVLTNQDILNVLHKHQPERYNQPDTHFSYTNTNYAILALVIEKITQLKYAEAMKYMLFEPLGMKHTFVMDYPKMQHKVSQSYYNNGRKWQFNYLDAVYGDKNIYSTPRDLLKLDVAMYGEKFLPQSLKDQIFKGYSYEAKGIKNYGLGIRLMEWETGQRLFYHNGWWHGNLSSFLHANTDSLTIIALGNRKNRTVYGTFQLLSLFGDYPFEPEEVIENDSLVKDSLFTDSIQLKFNEIKTYSKEKTQLKAEQISKDRDHKESKEKDSMDLKATLPDSLKIKKK